MAKVHNNNVARDAMKLYRSFVIEAAETNKEAILLLSDQEIRMQHEELKKRALQYFDEHQMSKESDSSSSSDFLSQLKKGLKIILSCSGCFHDC